MKKIKWGLLLTAAVACLLLMAGCGEKGSTGLEYTLAEDGNSWYVAGMGSCTDTDIVIPSEHEGKPVTSIGDFAFEDCSGLTSITIPDSVTSIGNSAFSHCTGLTSITIPDSVAGIGSRAFSGTAYYNDESNWSDGILYIGPALIGCKTDKTGAVSIKEGTTCIADSAFFGCESLTSITIPDSVTVIDYSAFYGCTSLTSITIPDSVTHIGVNAFSGTAYYNDESNWSDGILYIDPALIGCKTDKTVAVSIKEGTTCIAGVAFYDCYRLTSITIPDSVTSIGDYAFQGCTGLTSITIPDSVTSIGYDAFSGCSGLTSITFSGTTAQWKAIEKNNNWKRYTGSFTVHCTDGDIPYEDA